jgi:carotenoid cleavage dioxygenase-like enzyme
MTQVTFCEWEEDFTLASSVTHVVEDCPAPPHDFVITPDYFVLLQHRFRLELLPFLLGLKGPAACMVRVHTLGTW